MERNLNKRIELLVPVDDKKCKEKLKEILRISRSDNMKARELMPDGKYTRVEKIGEHINSQETFIDISQKKFEKFKKKVIREGIQSED